MAPKCGQKSMLTSKGDFSRIVLSLQRGLVLQDQEGRIWEQKRSKNRSKNEVNKGRHLGIDFPSILVDLGGQVGTENRPKIDPKGHWRPLLPFLDQDGAKIDQERPKMTPRWSQEGAKKNGLGPTRGRPGPIRVRSGANLGHLGSPSPALILFQ